MKKLRDVTITIKGHKKVIFKFGLIVSAELQLQK
jgi:hypothetical protein